MEWGAIAYVYRRTNSIPWRMVSAISATWLMKIQKQRDSWRLCAVQDSLCCFLVDISFLRAKGCSAVNLELDTRDWQSVQCVLYTRDWQSSHRVVIELWSRLARLQNPVEQCFRRKEFYVRLLEHPSPFTAPAEHRMVARRAVDRRLFDSAQPWLMVHGTLL